jgi:hypothetical protein
LQGEGFKINYATSGFDGKPHFSYKAHGQSLNFSGDQIRTTSTDLGTLVSVTTTRTVDLGYTTFTLIVPHVNMGTNMSVRISSHGAITRHKMAPLRGYPLGQTEYNSAVCLQGTASWITY